MLLLRILIRVTRLRAFRLNDEFLVRLSHALDVELEAECFAAGQNAHLRLLDFCRTGSFDN